LGDSIQVEYDPQSPNRNRARDGGNGVGTLFLLGIVAWILGALVRKESVPILLGWLRNVPPIGRQA
jgi:hypothetical protein